MTNLLVVTQTESDELASMLRRSVRPPPPGQAATPPGEAIFLAAVRAIMDVPTAALVGQDSRVLVVQGEAVAESDRIIRGAVLLFHNPDAGWALLGDGEGQVHLLDIASIPQEIDLPQLVDGQNQLVVDSALRANGSRGIRYRTLPLRPFFARHTKMGIAFDTERREWYRSATVEGSSAEHEPEDGPA